MPPELLAAIKLLAAHPDRAVVLKGLQDEAPGLRHEIFQAGHDVGYGKGKGELEASKGRVTELEGKVTKAEADLIEARKANPDVNKIHSDYQGQIADLNTKHTAALTEATGRVKTKEQTRAKAELRSKLEKLGVRPAMAEVEAERYANRLVADDAGELSVLQPGLTIPFAASGNKAPLDLLADAIREKVSADMIISTADGGSGERGDGGANLTGQAKLVADIKVKAEAERKARDTAASSIGSEGVPSALSHLAVRSS